MTDAEKAAADERLNKLPFPGVFTLWPDGELDLDGTFTAGQLEEVVRALRGPSGEQNCSPETMKDS